MVDSQTDYCRPNQNPGDIERVESLVHFSIQSKHGHLIGLKLRRDVYHQEQEALPTNSRR